MNKTEFDNIIKEQTYLGAMFTYGFITLCYLMDKYEKEGKYEECQLILNTLNKVNSVWKMKLPTKYDDDSWQYFLKEMNGMGFAGHITSNNIPYYAEEIENKIYLALHPPIKLDKLETKGSSYLGWQK